MTHEDTRVGSVDVAALRQMRDSSPTVPILDVRTRAEFETAHIPGSVNIPLAQLPSVCAEIAAAPGRLVVTCQAGPRSERAVELMRQQGCERAQVLEGGFGAWQAQGGKVEQGRPMWPLERQVRLVAGSLVLGGVLVSVRFPPARFLSGAVGAGLVFAAATDTCTMSSVLTRLPYNRRGRSDIRAAVDDLTGR